MKLVTYSSKYRPKFAGEAILNFDKYSYSPEREGKTITIPDQKQDLFFGSPDENTFLYIKTKYEEVYFGGTDEHAFLVELDTQEVKVSDYIKIWEEGKLAYYLKPDILREIEEGLKWKNKSKRQGDIWALPLDSSWQAILSIVKIFGLTWDVEFEKTSKEGLSIYGTRHRLEGQYCETRFRPKETKGHNRFGLLACGIIYAPDHSPLDISKYPHLIFQNDLLAYAAKAD